MIAILFYQGIHLYNNFWTGGSTTSPFHRVTFEGIQDS